MTTRFAIRKFVPKPERETKASGKRLRLVPLPLSMMVLANDWRQQRRTLTPDGASAEPIMSDGKTPRSLNWDITNEQRGRTLG